MWGRPSSCTWALVSQNCYISDLSKIHRHFPNWKQEYDLPRIIGEIVQAHRAG